MLRTLRQRREPSGTNRNSSAASAVPPAALNRAKPWPPRTALATVVATVTVAATGLALVILTGLPLTVSTGVLTAPDGEEVTAAVNVMDPR